MQLTRESEYALLGLAGLVDAPEGAVVSVADVADAQNLPAQFLAKIFLKLTRHGLLTSERGRGSGYALARSPEDISMRAILEAVEGPDVLGRCLMWQGHCHDTDPCPLHHRLKELSPAFRALLDEMTLADYVAESPHAARSVDQPEQDP